MKKKTFSYVVFDGCLPCKWCDDTYEGLREAENYAAYCNRNYVEYFTVRKMADADTLGFIKDVTSDIEKARAYAAFNVPNQRF